MRCAKFTTEILNERLSNFSIRLVSFFQDKIIFNNGYSLHSKKDVDLFKQRLYKKFDIDKAYNIDNNIRNMYIAEKRLLAIKKGGEITKKLFEDKIISNIGIWAKNNDPWNKGKKCPGTGSNVGKNKFNTSWMKKLSINRTGAGNPMFGIKQTEEQKNIASKRVKKAILDGKFTPNTLNSRTHWQNEYNSKKFRSSWEAAWWLLNPTHQYEKIRISYSVDNEEKIYIVDFADYENKILIEIKPKEHLYKLEHKTKAANSWARENGWEYKIVTQKYFIDHMEEIQNSDLPDAVKKRLKNIKDKNEN